MKSGSINICQAFCQMRLDSNFHLSEGLNVRKQIKFSPYKLHNIKDVTKDIYCPGIFRRNYLVSGVPFLGGADIQKFDYNWGKYLSEKNTFNHDILRIKKGWTLVTCGGTIGDTVFANDLLSRCWISQHVMRLVPDTEKIKEGMLYAYLATKYGKCLLTTGTYGTVIPTLNADGIANIQIPDFPIPFQSEIDELVQESAHLRELASSKLLEATKILKQEVGLDDLTTEDYDYFGPRCANRKPSCFTRNIKDIGTITINAFNHSKRIREKVIKKLEEKKHILLEDALDENKMFSSGGVNVIEVADGHGIKLINQSDIFDTIVKGKNVAKKEKYKKDLLSKGEVLIAKIGTLGEGETFCRCIYVGEELEGQLVSSAFYRMKTNENIPSGYLYTWLNSDYGFRLIRSTQFGTKLCYPNPELLYKHPMPILDRDKMFKIDELVQTAHNMRFQANQKELNAIKMVEEEIARWNK